MHAEHDERIAMLASDDGVDGPHQRGAQAGAAFRAPAHGWTSSAATSASRARIGSDSHAGRLAAFLSDLVGGLVDEEQIEHAPTRGVVLRDDPPAPATGQ